mmetsp:Transcript_74677/g.148414  ORF Transcript_74677/g.148414 Transcript_74677/m.148414 type:complete len:412 (+) Transcript_74677:92-1327(+)
MDDAPWRLEACASQSSTTHVIPLGTSQFGRTQLGAAFKYVSRIQVAFHVGAAPDSALSIESLGTNETGIRRGGTSAWTWLAKADAPCSLSHGDLIALDKKRRDGTMFVVRKAHAAVPSASAAAQWSWQMGSQWQSFPLAVAARLEAAWQANEPRIDVDEERHVNLRSMRQVRNDDLSRTRAVKREPPTVSAAAASSAAAALDESPPAKRPRLAPAEYEDRGTGPSSTHSAETLCRVGTSAEGSQELSSLEDDVGMAEAVKLEAAGAADEAGLAAFSPGVPPHAGPLVPDTSPLFFWGTSPSSGEKACLSNFYRSSFTDPARPGVRFFCMEQYFTLAKAELFGDHTAAADIIAEQSEPKQCKCIGRRVRNFDQRTWEARACDLIEVGVYLKFSQNPQLAVRASLATVSSTTG